VKDLLNAYNPDTIDDLENRIKSERLGDPPAELKKAIQQELEQLRKEAAKVFSGELNDYIENVRKAHDQKIDMLNPDELLFAGWDKSNQEKNKKAVTDFKEWLDMHKDEITTLQIFYNEPYRRREITYKMMKDLVDKIVLDKPALAPTNVWRAYEQLETVSGHPKTEMIALISLIRRVVGIDTSLMSFDKTVDRNFQQWILKKNAGQHNRFTEEQMSWLRMIKDHIASSVHIEQDDIDYTPFDAEGGRGKMWQIFGNEMGSIIDELNEELAA